MIYAFEGSLADDRTPLSVVEAYDPATDAWTEKSDMPVKMAAISTSVVDGKIYVIGGYDKSKGKGYDTVYEYDRGTARKSAKTRVGFHSGVVIPARFWAR